MRTEAIASPCKDCVWEGFLPSRRPPSQSLVTLWPPHRIRLLVSYKPLKLRQPVCVDALDPLGVLQCVLGSMETGCVRERMHRNWPQRDGGGVREQLCPEPGLPSCRGRVPTQGQAAHGARCRHLDAAERDASSPDSGDRQHSPFNMPSTNLYALVFL